jgi:hypothetical protein
MLVLFFWEVIILNREVIDAKYKKARSNLFLVVILSAVNVVLALMNADLTFLFAAIIPSLFIEMGRLFSEELGNQILFYIGVILAFMGVAIYGLCYILSKKYKALILVALILFSIDSLFLLWMIASEFDISSIIGIIFHVWVITCLASGVKAWADLKRISFIELTSKNNIEQTEINNKKCPFCEKVNDETAIFCQFCGGSLQEKVE